MMDYSPGTLTEYDRERNSQTTAAATTSSPSSYSPTDEARGLLVAAGVVETAPRPSSSTGLSNLSKPEPYQYLMGREDRVLKTLNRVVDDHLGDKKGASVSAGSSLLSMPIHELAMRTAGALRALLDDLVASRSYDDVKNALFDPDRMRYLGVTLVAIAILLGMIELMSHE